MVVLGRRDGEAGSGGQSISVGTGQQHTSVTLAALSNILFYYFDEGS